MAEIVASLSGQASPPHPQPRQTSAPAVNSSPASPASSGGGTTWVDPLEICTIRTAHLKNKRSAEFGWTRNNGTKEHQGLDLAAEPGTPIRAVANGRIYMAKAPNAGYAYGNTLVLEVGLNDLPSQQAALFRRDNPGRESIGFFYAHLSEFQYPITHDSKGKVLPATVHAGDIIGKTGCTGNAKGMDSIPLGAHLHFEVRQNALKRSAHLDNRVDPLPYIVNCTNR